MSKIIPLTTDLKKSILQMILKEEVKKKNGIGKKKIKEIRILKQRIKIFRKRWKKEKRITGEKMR